MGDSERDEKACERHRSGALDLIKQILQLLLLEALHRKDSFLMSLKLIDRSEIGYDPLLDEYLDDLLSETFYVCGMLGGE